MYGLGVNDLTELQQLAQKRSGELRRFVCGHDQALTTNGEKHISESYKHRAVPLGVDLLSRVATDQETSIVPHRNGG
jgi:hypothetical protein